MVILKFYLLLMPLMATYIDTSKHNIVIVGKAESAKDGACVLSKGDKKLYYLDGLDSWDEKIEGKTVKVWGKLLTKYIKPLPRKTSPEPGKIPPPPIPQQFIGLRRTILKPKWKLLNS